MNYDGLRLFLDEDKPVENLIIADSLADGNIRFIEKYVNINLSRENMLFHFNYCFKIDVYDALIKKMNILELVENTYRGSYYDNKLLLAVGSDCFDPKVDKNFISFLRRCGGLRSLFIRDKLYLYCGGGVPIDSITPDFFDCTIKPLLDDDSFYKGRILSDLVLGMFRENKGLESRLINYFKL